jgi:alkylated DNA nucleotide flippase Atl1
MNEDTIVDISPERERFFGCSGRMLKPSTATVAALIEQIPRGKLITTDALRAELARRFQVEVTCPSDTQKALRAIASDAGRSAAYWRVVKKTGEFMGIFPGGIEAHAARLKAEGFVVDTTRKAPRVKHLAQSVLEFDAASESFDA